MINAIFFNILTFLLNFVKNILIKKGSVGEYFFFSQNDDENCRVGRVSGNTSIFLG